MAPDRGRARARAADGRTGAGGHAHRKTTFQACRRILLTGGIYVSSDLGPFAQNLALPFATRVGRRPRRRVVFLYRSRPRRFSSTSGPVWRAALSGRSWTACTHSRTLSRPTATSRAPEGRQRRHHRPDRLTPAPSPPGPA